MISTRMPDDVVDKLKQLKDAETSSMGKIIYHTMFDNMQKAIDLNRPACQDTGEIMFFVKVGSRFPLLGELQSILKQAVEEATVKAPLRHNAVEIFDEVNTGKNTGSGVPWVTWDIIPDNDDAEIEVYMAGGGCFFFQDVRCRQAPCQLSPAPERPGTLREDALPTDAAIAQAAS